MVAIQHAFWEAYGKLHARKSGCVMLTVFAAGAIVSGAALDRVDGRRTLIRVNQG
jgi:hypothetical protein